MRMGSLGIMSVVFGYLANVLWLVVVLLIVWFVIRRFRGRHRSGDARRQKSELDIARSREEAVSEFFFLFSLLFFSLMLFALNRNMGDPLSWRFVLLLTSVFGFVLSYATAATWTLAVSVVYAVVWWGAQAAYWAVADLKTSIVVSGLALFMLLLLLVGRLHGRAARWKRFSIVYVILGGLGIAAAPMLFSTTDGMVAFQTMTKGALWMKSWQLDLSVVIFIAAFVSSAALGWRWRVLQGSEVSAASAVAAFWILLSLVPLQMVIVENSGALSGLGVFWYSVFHVLALLMSVGMLVWGVFRHDLSLRATGRAATMILFLVQFFSILFWQRAPGLLTPASVVVLLVAALAVGLIVSWWSGNFLPERWEQRLTIFGLVPVFILLFWLSSESGLRALGQQVHTLPHFSAAAIPLVVYTVLIAVAASIVLLARMPISPEFVFLSVLVLASVGTVLFPHAPTIGAVGKLNGYGVFWAVMTNLLAFASTIITLLLGYRQRSNLLINTGTVVLFLLIAVKYFDWFFTFLDKSVFFIGAGVLLLGIGWLMEKGRRAMLAAIARAIPPQP